MTTDPSSEKNKLLVHERYFQNGKRYFCVYKNGKLLLMTVSRKTAFDFVDRKDPNRYG
jgi:hypothetical protein